MHRKLLVGAVAVAAVGLGAAAIATAGTTVPAVDKTADITGSTVHLALRTMPTGIVTFVRDHGGYDATVDLYGLTPGSAHAIEIDRPGSVLPEVRIGAITADATGQVHTTAKGAGTVGRLAKGSMFVIRLGNNTGDFAHNALAAEAIATTDQLPSYPAGRTFALHAVSMNTNGTSLAGLSGTAKLVFNAKAKTLTITVNASGLAPGSAHAAHIHVGTCRSQGPVNMKFMFADLKADPHGRIVNQSRVITGVTAPPPAGKSYLNIHLGDMNTIVANGAPALSFRPLLCGNL